MGFPFACGQGRLCSHLCPDSLPGTMGVTHYPYLSPRWTSGGIESSDFPPRLKAPMYYRSRPERSSVLPLLSFPYLLFIRSDGHRSETSPIISWRAIYNYIARFIAIFANLSAALFCSRGMRLKFTKENSPASCRIFFIISDKASFFTR